MHRQRVKLMVVSMLAVTTGALSSHGGPPPNASIAGAGDRTAGGAAGVAAGERITQRAELPTFYCVTDLGTLGGSNAYALGINSVGHVCGAATLPGDGHFHATLWRDGAVIDLGVLTGTTDSYGYEIDGNDVVVGRSGEDTASRPFRWVDGVLTNLHPASVGFGTAEGITADGTVIGASNPTAGGYFAFAWNESWTPQYFDLGAPCETHCCRNSATRGANASGLAAAVANLCENPGDPPLGAFPYVVDNTHPPPPGPTWIKLPLPPPATNGDTRGLNDLGQVVGYCADSPSGPPRACQWERDGEGSWIVQVLPALSPGQPSTAFGIADDGVAVGEARNAAGESHAVLWAGGQVVDLNDQISVGSGWVLTRALSVNTRGEIVGDGIHNGVSPRAFLLAPRCRDSDACTWDRFVTGACVFTGVAYGDLDGSSFVDVDDILCSLSGFGDFCSCPGADIAPCTGDANIDVDDILAALDAFAGNDPCHCGG